MTFRALGLTLALLPICIGCSSEPAHDFGGPRSGAYTAKMDQVHLSQARRFLAEGKSAKARAELDQVSTAAQTAAMHLLVAESFLREGNAYAANEAITLASHLEPELAEVDMLRGMVAESTADWRTASKSYLLASVKDRGNLDPVLAHARVLHAMGDGVRAASYLDNEVSTRPVNFELSLATGEAYLSIGAHQDAVTHFSNAAEMEPEDPKAREGLVLSLSLAGAHQEALLRAGSLGPDAFSATARLALGRSALLAGEGQRAAKFLGTYLHEFDTDPAIWLDLARAYYMDRQDQRAIDAIGKVLKLNKQDPAAFTLLGHVRLRAKQYDLAFSSYERAIQAGGDAILLTELMDRARAAKERQQGGEL